MKKMLLRVDFNVPTENGNLSDSFRILLHLPTIRYFLRKNFQIFLLSHFGEPAVHFDSVHKFLENKLKQKIVFLKGKIPNKPLHFKEKIILFDNLRLNPGEKKNDRGFAKKLATFGDIFVNDAFSVSHRKHASIVSLPKFLPSRLGPLFKQEISKLSKFFEPKHPSLLVIGGNKFKTKEPLTSRFLGKADFIFVGGALANTFLSQRGNNIGKSLAERIKIPEKTLWSKKIILPSDFSMKNNIIYDSGPATAKILEELVKKSKFILWNGTLGLCEEGFDFGTKSFAEALGKSKAYKIAGGGDTVTAIRRFGLEKNFDFISTGGGAMLEFLATGTLAGIDAIKKKH
ncbi:MAG: phosphoglycerate kinase [Patescibacteria group bacterium]